MIRRFSRLIALGALAAALFVATFGSAGSVSAAIDPVAFQKLGCNVNDYSCYYARLYGGVPARVPYCDANGCSYNDAGAPYYQYPYYAAPNYVNSYYYANPAYVNQYVNSYYYANPYINAYNAGFAGYAYPYAVGGPVIAGNVAAPPANGQGGAYPNNAAREQRG